MRAEVEALGVYISTLGGVLHFYLYVFSIPRACTAHHRMKLNDHDLIHFQEERGRERERKETTKTIAIDNVDQSKKQSFAGAMYAKFILSDKK